MNEKEIRELQELQVRVLLENAIIALEQEPVRVKDAIKQIQKAGQTFKLLHPLPVR